MKEDTQIQYLANKFTEWRFLTCHIHHRHYPKNSEPCS